jgi:protein-tyrosine kinase
MSIVERALRRLQNSGQGRPPGSAVPREPRPPLRGSPGAAPVASEAAVPVTPAVAVAPAIPVARTAPTPAESLPVSLEELRTAGVLPLPEHADVLADQFRRVKWPILQSVTAKHAEGGVACNAVMVTSSVSGEGKTFTSLNLAMSIAAEKDYSVLLVDADVAKRHATRAFGAGDRAGLTDLLGDMRDPESLVLGTGIRGLTFLPSGRRQELAPELFASNRMLDVVRALSAADRRRIVLFDTSPLLATNESQVLAKVIDQVVLVVRAESTTQPMVLEAVSLLDRSKEIRCILNQAHASELAEYYYYGYGKGNESQEG